MDLQPCFFAGLVGWTGSVDSVKKSQLFSRFVIAQWSGTINTMSDEVRVLAQTLLASFNREAQWHYLDPDTQQPASKEALVRQWEECVSRAERAVAEPLAQLLQHRPSQRLRIATFNVHFWTNAREQNRFVEIMDTIRRLDADLILLNEMVFGDFKYQAQHIPGHFAEALQPLYRKYVVCNTVPSWFNNPYGNVILIHERVARSCTDALCSAWDESIGTFPKPVQLNRLYPLAETRCYVRLYFPPLDLLVYGTHLDVTDPDDQSRKRALQVILKDQAQHKARHALIMGDFNTLNPRDLARSKVHQRELQTVYQHLGNSFHFRALPFLYRRGWHDVFELVGTYPRYSVWTGTRVDFLMVNPALFQFLKERPSAVPFVVPTTVSDHLPLVLDVPLS